MIWCFIITYILNIVDLFFTVYWVDMYGINAEFSPLGKILLEHNLAPFIKVMIVGILIMFLSYNYNNKYAKIGIVICMIVYIIVFIIHLILWFYIN